MKKWFDSSHISLILSITIAGLLIVSLYFAILNIQVFVGLWNELVVVLTPFMYGLILAFLMSPIVNFFEKKVFIGFKWKNNTKRIVSVILSLPIILISFAAAFPKL